MTKVAIVYFSGYGHNQKLADAIIEGVVSTGAEALNLKISSEGGLEEAQLDEIDSADAIIYGAPTYMGGPAWQFKRFADQSTGPLFGSRAPWATGVPGDIERAVIAELGSTPDLLSKAGAECGFRGERRALRVRLNDLAWSLDGAVLTLSFWLPPGSYATSVLREVVKNS